MARVKLAAEIDAELRHKIEIAAANSDKTVGEWIERALARELELASYASEEVEITIAEPGQKPRGLSDPPRLEGEGTLADMVIEDRR